MRTCVRGRLELRIHGRILPKTTLGKRARDYETKRFSQWTKEKALQTWPGRLTLVVELRVYINRGCRYDVEPPHSGDATGFMLERNRTGCMALRLDERGVVPVVSNLLP